MQGVIMNKQLTLLDFSDSDDEMIKKLATEAVDDGDFLTWDHAYESLWANFEQYPEYF